MPDPMERIRGIAALEPRSRVAVNAPRPVTRLYGGVPKDVASLQTSLSWASPVLEDHGGRVLTSVLVKPVFWGTAWYHPWLHPGPSVGDVLWALKSLFLGPFMSGLSQYRGVGRGTVLDEIFVSLTLDPPNPFTADDIENMLRSLTVVPYEHLVDPALDAQLLVCVFTPPGFTLDDQSAAGFHSSFSTPTGSVPYAWIGNHGTLESVSAVYSHELAEACSDPTDAFFTTDGSCGQSGRCEVSDYCYGHGEGRGWWKIGGVLLQGYWSVQDGRCILPSERAVPGVVSGNVSLIQGRFLSRGNFEMVAPLDGGGLAHYSRVNDDAALPWFGPTVFATEVGKLDAVSLIQSNYTAGGGRGNLELVARWGGELLFYWREDIPPYVWHGPSVIPLSAPGENFRLVCGNPSLVQGRFGTRGNFELVVPLASGGIAHYSRVNDLGGAPWSGPAVFATDIGPADAVALAQSNLSSSGNGAGDLHVVVRTGGQLLFYRRDDAPPYTWHGPELLPARLPGGNVLLSSGMPSLVFQNFGTILYGYDQLVCPLEGGGFAHYTRDNNEPGSPWRGPVVVATDVGVGPFAALSLIHSNFSSTNSGVGNLELVALVGHQLVHFWREDNSQVAGNDSRAWYGPWLVTW